MGSTPAKRVNGWHKGTIETLASGSLRARVRVEYPDGTHARLSRVCRTKTEAQRAIIEMQQEARAGVRPVSDRLTVGEMVTEYMRAKTDGNWSHRTALNNQALYTRHVMTRLADKRAAGLQPRDLRDFFAALSASKLGYSGQRQIHVLLVGAYKRAIADGLLRDNPAQHARPVSPAKSGLAVVAKVKHFTPEELGRFIDAALQDRGGLVLAFLGLTGLRIGEALGLTWADVLEAADAPGVHFVSVSKTRSEFEGAYYLGRPKTAAGVRRVVLGADAWGILQDLRRRIAVEARAERYRGSGLAPDAPVFAAVDGRPMRQDVARAVMRRTCQAAGVPLLSPHALRHSVGTFHIAAGRDAVTVAQHLGHGDPTTTLKIYAHAIPDNLQEMGLDRAALTRRQIFPKMRR